MPTFFVGPAYPNVSVFDFAAHISGYFGQGRNPCTVAFCYCRRFIRGNWKKFRDSGNSRRISAAFGIAGGFAKTRAVIEIAKIDRLFNSPTPLLMSSTSRYRTSTVFFVAALASGLKKKSINK